MASEVKQRSVSKLSSAEVLQRLSALEGEISSVQSKTDHAATATKRKLWCSLEELRLDYDSSGLIKDEDLSKRFAEAEAKLTLRYHAVKRSPLGTVVVYIRLGAILLCNIYLCLLFFVLAPIRFLHPTLRKIGIHNNILPMDLWQRFWAFSMSSIMGFRARLEGYEHVKKYYETGSPIIGTFQHSSSYDLLALMANSPLVFKWIAKKSLMYIPLIGWMGFLLGMIFIDRSNREKAIQSMKKAGKQVHKWGRSIAIAPEGTRTASGQLGEFKKGAFYLALEAQVPIVPILLPGCYQLWPAKSALPTSTGQAVLRFLPPIDTTKFSPEQHDELMVETKRTMLRGMAQQQGPEWQPLPFIWHVWSWNALYDPTEADVLNV